MVRFIKEAVSIVTHGRRDEFFNGVACTLVCMDSTDSLTEKFDSFDLVRIAKDIKLSYTKECKAKCKKVDECSPLDYAALYESVYNGSSIHFLRTYQDHFGQIE